jgi:hypothetical protein
MSLLTMLKKGVLRQSATAIPATFATVAPLTLSKVARVATVAVANIQTTAANDPTTTTTVQSVCPPQDVQGKPMPPVDTTVADIGTVRPAGLSAKLLAASQALDAQIAGAGGLPGNEPDRWCYPNSTAMTGSEIDLFAARLARFTDKGVPQADAESLVDRLVQRDRDSDDRALCGECTHLSGYGASSWRCGNWQRAGVAHRARDVQLPRDLVFKLQRCDGLTHAFNPTTKVS